MHAVLVAWRRERLAVAWLAFALAGLGFAAHPTGFTLLAPLLAGLPLLWRLVAVPGHRAATALRVVAVASGGMVAPLLAFVDGGLRDFLRGQRIFLAIQAQESWATEIQRYDFLLTQIPMGNYAKRMAVLLCLVSLVWFAVLAVAARMRQVPLPVALWFSASTTALAFAALWFTPSKWTHHFGALAGVGSAFLALFLALAVPTVRSVLERERLPFGLVAAAAGSYVLAIALSWHGPNQWPYAWLDGVRRPEFPPAIKRVLLDSPLLWLLVLAVVVVALTVPTPDGRHPRPAAERAARRPDPRGDLPGRHLGLHGGTFGLAAVQGVPRSSLWAQSLADPTASRCAAAAGDRGARPVHRRAAHRGAGLPAPPPATGFVTERRLLRRQPAPGRRRRPGLGQPGGPRRRVGRQHAGPAHHVLVRVAAPLRGHGHGDRRGQPVRRRRADGGVRPPLGRRGRTGGHRGRSPTPRTIRRGAP